MHSSREFGNLCHGRINVFFDSILKFHLLAGSYLGGIFVRSYAVLQIS